MPELDVVIFGGGAAGLWLLDELHRRGFGVCLIESRALGAGQTVASQGIIHGGVKYAFSGLLSDSATAIRDMPALWRACLAGNAAPDLGGVRVFAQCCHLWRTESLKSWAALLGARAGLRSATAPVLDSQRPEALRHVPGEVWRVDEQVIDAVSLLGALAKPHGPRMAHASAEQIEIVIQSPGVVAEVRVGERAWTLRPRHVVFTAGEGNAALRGLVGLNEHAMQRRPLHMVMARGALPELYGHCVDGTSARVTVTSAMDSGSRRVWQVGGNVAEQGVAMSAAEVIQFARRELEAVLPGVEFDDVEWASYRIDRAEGMTAGESRPAGPTVRVEGNTITAWPTKLALVPHLVREVAARLGHPAEGDASAAAFPPDTPRPPVALPPWERCTEWSRCEA